MNMSKRVSVVTVADVSDEDHVGNSLLQIWKLGFRHIHIKFANYSYRNM